MRRCTLGGAERRSLAGELVRNSLVVRRTAAGRDRYRLLETVRVYAARTARRGCERQMRHSVHAAWYLTWPKRPRPTSRTGRGGMEATPGP